VFALPRSSALNATQARSYEKQLAPLQFSFKGRPFPYGHLLELPQTSAEHLVNAASTVERLIVGQIRERGVTAWLSDHAPQFGDEVLNYPHINRQLEKRLFDEQLLLPIAYDGLIVLEHGRPQFRVIEIQSGVAHGPAHCELIRAAGRDPDALGAWYGPENPFDVFRRMKRDLAHGENGVVIDTNPYAGGARIDHILMAKTLGRAESMPIAAPDIQHDAELGYFAHRYILNPMTHMPLADPDTGRFLTTEEKIPIKNILSRLTQPDLDELDKLVGGNQAQRSMLERFFQDASLNWLQHPSWQYLIDKSTLPFIWHHLEAHKSPIQAHFVPVYGHGDRIPPGTYVYKSTHATKGDKQEIRKVPEQATVYGEEGYVYQKLLQPYPFPLPLASELAGAFPLPSHPPTSWQEDILFAGWDKQVTAGTVEIRAMSLPWGRGDQSMYFLVRLAPRYSEKGNRRFTQTNIARIRQAVDQFLPQELHPLAPFGWCPMVVSPENQT
jgi:hypothetical protein